MPVTVYLRFQYGVISHIWWPLYWFIGDQVYKILFGFIWIYHFYCACLGGHFFGHSSTRCTEYTWRLLV